MGSEGNHPIALSMTQYQPLRGNKRELTAINTKLKNLRSLVGIHQKRLGILFETTNNVSADIKNLRGLLIEEMVEILLEYDWQNCQSTCLGVEHDEELKNWMLDPSQWGFEDTVVEDLVNDVKYRLKEVLRKIDEIAGNIFHIGWLRGQHSDIERRVTKALTDHGLRVTDGMIEIVRKKLSWQSQ